MSQTIEKLTYMLLTDKNYHILARQATFGLIDRNKLKYINDEKPILVPKKLDKPTEEEKKTLRE
jgi:hypothetical protein